MKPSLLTLLSLFFIGGYSLKSEAVSVNLGSVQGVSFRSQFDLVQKYSESENQSEYFGLQLALAKSDTESLERDEGKLAPVLGLVGGSVIKITDRLQTRIQVAIGRAGFIKKAVYTSILQTIDFPPISLKPLNILSQG